MSDLKEWFKEIVNVEHMEFPIGVTVSVEHYAHVGPREEYAKVAIRFEPADELMLSISDELYDENGYKFSRFVFFGCIDVLAVYPVYPCLKVNIVIESLEYDFTSNERAFRFAGRKAACKALADVGIGTFLSG